MGYRDEDRPKRSDRSRSNDGSPRSPRDGERRSRPGGTSSFGSSSSRSSRSGGNADSSERTGAGRRRESSGRGGRGEAPRTERSRGSYDANRPEWANSRCPENPDRKRSPLIPDEITDKDVEVGVRAQLKTLTPENAEKVARHLAMVGLLIDQDPELAHEHALAAAERAGRIAMVRETVGCTAYAIGDFALALRELLTHRRISGSNEQIALIVDSERGLGRPDRALEVGRSVDRKTLSAQARVNLAIALSGARLDKGELDLALAELEIPELNPAKVFDYSPALFFAYADVLEDLGRAQESKRWADLGNRAAKALAGEGADEDETVMILEEIEIPVRREWIPDEQWQAQRSVEGGGERRYGRGGEERGESRSERGDGARGAGRSARGTEPRGQRDGSRSDRGGDGRGSRSSGPRVNRDEYRPKRDK